MAVKVSHTKASKGDVPRKSLRILKTSHQLPHLKTFIVRGDTRIGVKLFRFQIVTASQQMKERNNAYQFFSID